MSGENGEVLRLPLDSLLENSLKPPAEIPFEAPVEVCEGFSQPACAGSGHVKYFLSLKLPAEFSLERRRRSLGIP